VQTLATILRKKLKGAKKIGILGVGSELRADDIVGLLVSKQIRKSLGKSRKVKIFLGYTAPENFTSQIKKFKPSHLIIIDALDMAKKPGAIAVIEPTKTDILSFSTHKFPIKLLIDYLFAAIACETIIVGIQPKSLAFSGQVSQPVRKAVEKLSLLLIRALSGL
jgi:hydrogenase 3 maturation protease